MASFIPALQFVLRHEGGLEANEFDSAGITKYGISLTFYRSHVDSSATADDIKNLSVDDASGLYEKFWWSRAPFCYIDSQKIANRVFDLHVNTYHGISMLQQAVNACIGGHLVIDDMLGPKTLAIVNALDEDKLYDMLIVIAEHFYNDLVKKNPKDEVFYKGWINRLKD